MTVESFHASGSSPTRIAILGFGTVGRAVARRLVAPQPGSTLELTHILDRRAEQKYRGLAGPAASRVVWTSSIDNVLASNVDIVVESIGGIDPAADWIRRALLAGKSVVTANKQVIAAHGHSLLKLAARQGRQLRFEAAVGGAIPIVRAIADGLAGDRLTRIVAILNGTTNAVLSRMDQSGCSLDDALQDARARGYAEADPSFDIDGTDARAKLAILCALAFGLRVDADSIPTQSSASIGPDDFAHARRRGCTIRQIARAEFDNASSTLAAFVGPAFVPRNSLFGRTVGPNNAALITGVDAGEIGISGPGAGGPATAVAILSDLLAIARDRAAIVPAPVTHSKFQILHSKFVFAEAV